MVIVSRPRKLWSPSDTSKNREANTRQSRKTANIHRTPERRRGLPLPSVTGSKSEINQYENKRNI